MNGFYGKTIKNYGCQSTGERLIFWLRSHLSELSGLDQAFSRRPLLLPAVLLITCCMLSFWSESVIPAALMCVVVVFVGVSYWQLKKNANALFLALIICLMLLNSGFYISSRLNAREDTGNTEFLCRITSVSRDMSGDIDVTVRLKGGAYCVLKYYGKDPLYKTLKSGDVILVQGKIKEPRKAGNPGEFDYREYLKKQGILYVVTCDSFEVSEGGFPSNVTGFLQDFSLLQSLCRGRVESPEGTTELG